MKSNSRMMAMLGMSALMAAPAMHVEEEVNAQHKPNNPTRRKEKNDIAMAKAVAKRQRRAAKRLQGTKP